MTSSADPAPRLRFPPRTAVTRAALLAGLIGALALPTTTGCGDGGGIAVQGAVSVAGQQVDEGTIHFQPKSAPGARGVGGAIEDGRFQFEPDAGLTPGSYRVRVEGLRRTGRTVNDYQRGPIPERVAVSNAPLETDVEVKADSPLLKIELSAE